MRDLVTALGAERFVDLVESGIIDPPIEDLVVLIADFLDWTMGRATIDAAAIAR